MDENTVKLTYQAIRTYREERDLWIDSYYELEKKSKDFIDENKQLMNDLKSQIDEERLSWKKELSNARKPGIGAFIGPGVTAKGNVELVLGVGLVFKF